MTRKDTDKQFEKEKAELLAGLAAYHRRWNPDLVEKAFDLAVEVHRDQRRQSGELFVTHPIAVAKILIDLKTDYIAVTASLLHDVIEDSGLTYNDLQEKFGEQIALLVDGVTKISGLRFRTYEERQSETLRKMLLSMLKDLRVILIKLADRLHNMRTIEALPRKAQRRIALETRDVYAALAHRLGIARWAREMEELALRVLDPQAYEEIMSHLASSVMERQAILDEVIAPIDRELRRQGLTADVHSRVKGIASIYSKMHTRGKNFDEINDLLAIRIIVHQKTECYRILGIVHDLYTPVTDHFTDFIALPKSNLYQSLHTKVRDLHNRIIEIQIRTYEMHALAENGIAAHWRYKEGLYQPDELDSHYNWIRSLMEAHQESAESGDFIESLKIDLFQDEIFVFTPKGKLYQLPKGATPIDFAFAIHSDIGFHAIGAKVGGKVVSLTAPLASGDIVEILTSPSQHPTVDWLRSVRTSRARNRIKKWFKDTRWDQSVSLGREIIQGELTRLKLRYNPEQIQEVALTFGYTEVQEFFALVGGGSISLSQVMPKLLPIAAPDKESLLDRIIPRPDRSTLAISAAGLDSMVMSIADCCHPLPGDPIIAFHAENNGLQIHRSDCSQVAKLLEDKAKIISVTWDVEREDRFKSRISFIADDRPNLLRDITQAVAAVKVNIIEISVHIEENLAVGYMVAEVRNILHLTKLIARINQVQGMLKAERQDLISDSRVSNGERHTN